MEKYKVDYLFEISGDLKRIWLDHKKEDSLSYFEIFGLDNALDDIISKFPDEVKNGEPIFSDNGYWFDCENNTRCQICLTITEVVMVLQFSEDGELLRVFRVEFGF